MDRGAWQATVHRVTKSQTQLKRLSMHSGMDQARLISRGRTGSELGSRSGRRDGLKQRHPGGKPGNPVLILY